MSVDQLMQVSIDCTARVNRVLKPSLKFPEEDFTANLNILVQFNQGNETFPSSLFNKKTTLSPFLSECFLEEKGHIS